MKTSVILSVILSVVACVAIAGALLYINKPKTSPTAPPVAESTSNQTDQAPSEKVVAKAEPQPAPAAPVAEPAPVIAAPTAESTNSTAATNSIAKVVDDLLSAKGGKHALFEQLRKSGQLEAVIGELQQRANANPTDPEIHTTLGEAQLNQIRALKDAGADVDQLGILAMQADQNFNTALKTDPQNWEAQFVKASSMVYWPPEPTRDAGVIKTLTGLIDQQDTMPSQPQFDMTYATLYKEYEKLGRHDEAEATRVLGLQKFPGDPVLLNLKSGPPQ